MMISCQAPRTITCLSPINLPCGVRFFSSDMFADHVADIHRIAADIRDAFERIQTYPLVIQESTKFSLRSFLCRGGSMFTTGILDLYEINNLQESGTTSPCKEASDYVEHEILHQHLCDSFGKLCGSFSTRTPSTLTSASNRSASTTPGESCTIILSKANMTRFYKVLCDVLPFRRAAASGQTSLHCFAITHQQCLRQEKRHCQENHPGRSCSYDLSGHGFGRG